jgi:hypothetical protein
MKGKHERTLRMIFSRPTPATLAWREVESLLVAVGAVVEERARSRVAVELNGVPAVFHRPHPAKEMDPAAVRQMRKFLTDAGVEP